MRKIIFVIAIAFAVAAASCTQKAVNNDNTVNVDSVQIDSAQIDTTLVDTL